MTIPVPSAAMASRFLSRWLLADPQRSESLMQCAQAPMTPEHCQQLLQNSLEAGVALPAAMRRLRNLVVNTLITRDLSGIANLDEVVRTMTAFADFAIQTHLQALMQEMEIQHGTPIGNQSQRRQELIVIGMGKLGGGELNVSSDIDLIFIYPEGGETVTKTATQRSLSNHEFFSRLGKKLIGALSEITEDGFSFRVDMALRPNGGSGSLVASLDMLEQYLIYQGREWERYAWIKARALSGQASDIITLQSICLPFVYRRYLDFGSIDALRSMHAQIRTEVKRQELLHPDRSNNVKLGRGGIREVEFIAQVFQLIRGGRDPELRHLSTRTTLEILAKKQLIKPAIAQQLLHAYTFLRNLEHRLQYLDDAQTHTLPSTEKDVMTIASMMGYTDTKALLTALEQQRHIVATQFDAIFSDKHSQHDDTSSCTLTENDDVETTTEVLRSLGFEEAAAAAQRLLLTLRSPRLQLLPEISHSRLIQLINTALPLIAQFPDAKLATLSRLLDFLETIARRAAYLALLTEYPHALTRLIRIIHASDWAAKYLTRHPLLLDELLDDRTLKAVPDWDAFTKDCQSQLNIAAADTERQMDILREMHHAQLFRLLAQDLEGELSVEHLADYLSALADTIVAIALQAAWNSIPTRHRPIPQFAIIAYGKLGGKELGYASDLDVVFLYDDDDPEAPALYARLAQRFITWMTTLTSAGTLFDIDVALRPDGASGLMVSSFKTFEKYQLNSAWIWEHQALTRARFCAGDSNIGHRFEALRDNVLRQKRDVSTLRREVLAMRKKMAEAHPRSTQFDLKNDLGGMIDIEFIVQFLVLRYASTYPQLTADIGNIALLKLCGDLQLINATLANDVADAYRVFRKLQHQIRLQGEERARTDIKPIKHHVASVKELWEQTFSS